MIGIVRTESEKMDDITFCTSGFRKECGVVRCERHPNNITDRTIPHSFAEFYQTEYCPLEKPTVKDMVEVVRCRDCEDDDFCKYGVRKE